MTYDEFREIHEAWAEVKACFDEIDACNAEARGKGIVEFDANATPRASAH